MSLKFDLLNLTLETSSGKIFLEHFLSKLGLDFSYSYYNLTIPKCQVFPQFAILSSSIRVFLLQRPIHWPFKHNFSPNSIFNIRAQFSVQLLSFSFLQSSDYSISSTFMSTTITCVWELLFQLSHSILHHSLGCSIGTLNSHTPKQHYYFLSETSFFS